MNYLGHAFPGVKITALVASDLVERTCSLRALLPQWLDEAQASIVLTVSLPSEDSLTLHIQNITCKGIFRSFGLRLPRQKEMCCFDVVLWKLSRLSTPFGMFLTQGMSTCFSLCRLSFCGRTNHWEISEERFATVSGVFLVHSMLKEVFEVRDQENDAWMFLFSSPCVNLFTMLSPPYLAKGSTLNSVLWPSGYLCFRPWGGTCRLL